MSFVEQVTNFLLAGDIPKAHALSEEYQKSKPVDPRRTSPFAINIPADQAIKSLQFVFKANPKKLSGLSNEDVKKLQLSVALQRLGFYGADLDYPLNDFAGLPPLKNQRLRILLSVNAKHLEDTQALKRMGIAKVQSFSSGVCCESCAKLADRQFNIEDAPEIPSPDCLELKSGTVCHGVLYKPVINFDDE